MPRRTHAYAVAIADAAAHGARWVVSLDAELRRGMTSRDPAALERWNAVMSALSASERLRVASGPPRAVARLGVLSDFEGPNEFMSHEMLNLSARRHLAYRVLPVDSSKESDLEGLQGVIFMDANAPADPWAPALVRFVEHGGLLILPHGAAGYAATHFRGAGTHENGYKLFKRGKGTAAVAPEEWADPYLVSAEAHRLLSRREDVYRAWNPGASSIYVEKIAPDRVRAHIINYTGAQTSDLMALYVAGKYKSVKWSHLFGVTSEPLTLEQRPAGAEVKLPPFAAYAAVEFMS
jgi:hypothetical protein